MMKKTLTWLVMALMLCSPLARAAEPTVAGHYYLQGVREVGAELLLKTDGSFQWSMSYGAFDQFAQGRWTQNHDTVELHSGQLTRAPHFRLFREDELRTRPAEAGSWVAIVGMHGVGPMAGVDVTFESQSGKRVSALSQPNGDAIVQMPAHETWRRAGLRRHDSQDAVQWFDIPAARAQARLAAFAVDDAAYLLPSAFQHMTLTLHDGALVVGADDGGLGQGMEYRKQ